MSGKVYKCCRCGRYPKSRLEKQGQDTYLIVTCHCRIHKHNIKEFTPGEALRAWNKAQQKEL